jgi:transposase
MEVIHPRVAGIDVHKKIVWVAVRLPGERPGERTVTVKRFKSFWRPLRQMAAWLAEPGVTDAAMESTGVYWWPVYHALAQAGIEVCVCNAAHLRNVPGRKPDVMDCQWIAELHEHGLLRTGFIPAGAVAGLRVRTRYRKKLTEQRTSEGQRLAKVLEDAGIKTGLGGLPAAGRLRPGDDRGADRRGAQSRAAGRPGAGPAAPQDRGAAAGLRWPVHRRPRPDVPAAPGRLRPSHRQDRRAGAP